MTMKHRLVIFGLAAIVAGSLNACGGSDGAGSAATTSPSTIQALDTAQVLAQSRETSETTYPYPVNFGVVFLTDTSDFTDPYVIPGT
jgi:hypothetical protein